MPSASRQDEELPPRAHFRDRWPRGILGALAFWLDHRVHGYDWPVPWTAVAAWEHGGMGHAVFANGGVMILLGNDVSAAQMIALGGTDQHVAAQLRMSVHKVRRLRRAIAFHLGITQPEDLHRAMESLQYLP